MCTPRKNVLGVTLLEKNLGYNTLKDLVWIRFHVLNLVYYDDSFLLVMPSTIGLHIKVNNNTLKMECGRFA
ncbi:hypothetical protein MTR_5g018950 [Medicago truncatula]|uniref:Uncharacterized protein n=1 Tax=Medicago truncatula TaxID=3880 RepID=G7KAS5_MEDTR|nr:hypothetical protein MTR_5g018950 [Medicago truncatula]